VERFLAVLVVGAVYLLDLSLGACGASLIVIGAVNFLTWAALLIPIGMAIIVLSLLGLVYLTDSFFG